MLPRLAADEKFDANALYEKGVRSCVFLVVPLKEGPAEGTGTLIDAKQRLVLTCFHIVDESDTVAAQFPVRLKDGSLEDKKKKYLERVKDGQAIKGKVLFRDKSRDLALVQLDKLPPDTPALPLDKDSVRVDEVVISIGNWRSIATAFFTMRHTVRAVEVMDLAFGRGDGAFRIKAKMIHLTEPGPVPTSGGPVIDRHGHLVALKDGVPIGIGSSSVSIDVTEVRAFLTENKVELPEPKAEPGPKK
jgi:S1-C subfamily serine protease